MFSYCREKLRKSWQVENKSEMRVNTMRIGKRKWKDLKWQGMPVLQMAIWEKYY